MRRITTARSTWGGLPYPEPAVRRLMGRPTDSYLRNTMISVRLSAALAATRTAALAAGLPAMILLAGCGSQPSSGPGASATSCGC